MDAAVALVDAYLGVNGYLTAVETPILEIGAGLAREATDIDIVAFRFCNVARPSGSRSRRHGRLLLPVEFDPELRSPSDRPDMIVGEVKQGRPSFNPAALDPAILSAAISRFGCCSPSEGDAAAAALLATGRAVTACGHLVRLVAFGNGIPVRKPPCLSLSLTKVEGFLRAWMKRHWEILQHIQFRHPGLAFLRLLQACESRRPTEPGFAIREARS